MEANMRRIITGHNENRKSVISIDGPPARSLGEDAGGLYEIWNTDGDGFNTTSVKDRADRDVLLSPSKGGTKIRYFQINPIPEGVPQEVISLKKEGEEINVYQNPFSGEIVAIRSSQWRMWDLMWGLHIIDWVYRDNISNIFLKIFSFIALFTSISGLILFFKKT